MKKYMLRFGGIWSILGCVLLAYISYHQWCSLPDPVPSYSAYLILAPVATIVLACTLFLLGIVLIQVSFNSDNKTKGDTQ